MLIHQLDKPSSAQDNSYFFSFYNLPDGIYFVASESNGQRDVTKIIVF